jgi:dipeptide/tripeptide permease
MERILKFFKSLTEFNQSFWSANISELFERIAFYGMTSFLVIYLTEIRGIQESAAIRLNGNFGLVVYGLPVLSGFLADWMGFRRAIMMAYAFLAVGYFLAGQFTTYWSIAGALLLVAFGASLIKPCITGTVQKTSPAALGALGFSIYYTLVNIGGFLAPNTHGWVAESFGVERVFMASSGVIVLALLLIFFAFREPVVGGEEKEKKSLGSFLRDFLTVVLNGRLMLLFLFVAGFWSMFFQFFGALPLYLRTDLGVESERLIGLIISLDALTIVIFQVIVGYLVRNIRTDKAVLLGVTICSEGAGGYVHGLRLPAHRRGELAFRRHRRSHPEPGPGDHRQSADDVGFLRRRGTRKRLGHCSLDIRFPAQEDCSEGVVEGSFCCEIHEALDLYRRFRFRILCAR